MSSFNWTGLANHRVLVTGTDHAGVQRSTILSSIEFDQLKAKDAEAMAHKDFDAAVEAFFAPLTEAVDKVEQATKEVRDPAFYLVVQEASAGCEEKREVLHHLGTHTVVLRMIDSGNTDRLIWIGDQIEVLAYTPPVGIDLAKDYIGSLDAVDLNENED